MKKKFELVTFSAKNSRELDHLINACLKTIAAYPDITLSDIAYFLAINHNNDYDRFFIVTDSLQNLMEQLMSKKKYYYSYKKKTSFSAPEIIFTFPGLGSEYLGMGKQLYEVVPVFKKYMDHCNSLIKKITKHDIISIYFYSDNDPKNADWHFRSTVALTAILSIEWSLASLLIDFGVKPNALIGYSMGEVTAGVVSGLFNLEDALNFMLSVAKHSYDLDDGELIAIKATPYELNRELNEFEIASINSSNMTILGGKKGDIQKIITQLEKKFVIKKIGIPCAYHTSLVKTLKDRLSNSASHITFSSTKTPIYCTSLGRMAKPDELSSTNHWKNFLTTPMNLKSALTNCLENYKNAFFIEVGPSSGIATLIREITQNINAQEKILSEAERKNEVYKLMITLGKAWLHGCNIHWPFIFKEKKLSVVKKIALIFGENIKSNMAQNEYETNSFFLKKSNFVIIQHIFKKVLLCDTVAPHDNFFMLGGDSLLAMQCVSLLNNVDIDIDLHSFTENPTVSAIANFSKKKNSKKMAYQSNENNVPLIPLQERFFKKPKHWSHQKLLSITLFSEIEINLNQLKLSCEYIVSQHDALRLQFQHKNNTWIQTIRKNGAVDFETIALTPAQDIAREISSITAVEEASFDIHAHQLIKFRLIFHNNTTYFIIFFHHLCVDGVSISIILKQLMQHYHHLEPIKNIDSFKKWANYLKTFSKNLTENDVLFWENQGSFISKNSASNLKNNFSSSIAEYTFNLNKHDTALIFRKSNANLGVGIFEILLLISANAYYHWCGIKEFYVDVRAHGRNNNLQRDDFSETVGWFTVVYPLLVRAKVNNDDIRAALATIKNLLKAAPYQGLSYGVLRYLSENSTIRERMDKIKSPEIAFNYHGYLDHIHNDIKPFLLPSFPIANTKRASVTRSHLINIDAMIFNETLSITLTYNKNIHDEIIIKNYADLIIDGLQTILGFLSVCCET